MIKAPRASVCVREVYRNRSKKFWNDMFLNTQVVPGGDHVDDDGDHRIALHHVDYIIPCLIKTGKFRSRNLAITLKTRVNTLAEEIAAQIVTKHDERLIHDIMRSTESHSLLMSAIREAVSLVNNLPCEQSHFTALLEKQARSTRAGKPITASYYCKDSTYIKVTTSLENDGKKMRLSPISIVKTTSKDIVANLVDHLYDYDEDEPVFHNVLKELHECAKGLINHKLIAGDNHG